MLTRNLEIRFSGSPLRPPVAWLIPGDTWQDWMGELARWQTDLDDLAFYVLPRSRDDRRPCGMLIVPGPQSAPKTVSPRCHPYGRLTDRLYLPVEARLSPEVTEAELHALLGNDTTANGDTFVFHPTVGLVRFAPEERLRLSDLYDTPAKRTKAWNLARPGMAINRRLQSVEPEQIPTYEQLLELARDGIGTEPPSPDMLPPIPDEPGSGPLHDLGHNIARGFFSLVSKLAQMAPAISGNPTWINKVQQWAQRKLKAATENLAASRHRELGRLFHMLQNNPDQGLRYAIPFGGASHRGLAAPSGKLAQRDIDFNLQRLGRSWPADFWDMPGELQQRLAKLYRELANREIRLGRHRRAAYIYAELLGDLSTAAATLADGKHYREAAVLYRERLRRPWEAARCLRNGGLLSEAITLYEELGAFVEAGELYEQLDQPESAQSAFRSAVERHQRAGDFVAAAHLLENKLHAPDEALAVLDAGSSDSVQASACLQELFRLLGRLGRHNVSRDRIDIFVQTRGTGQATTIVDILASVALTYPDPNVAARAADSVKVLTADRLPSVKPAEAELLLAAVARVSNEDLLLKRDCQRYLRGAAQGPRPKKAPADLSARRLRLEFAFNLPNGVQWQKVVATDETLYALGRESRALALVRATWSGRVQSLGSDFWKCPPGLMDAPLLLAADPQDKHQLLAQIVGADEPLAARAFRVGDDFRGKLVAGSPSPAVPGIVALDRAHGGSVWALVVHHTDLVLSGWSADGELVSTELVGAASVATLPCLHARADAIFVGYADQLRLYPPRKSRRPIQLPGPVCSLIGSPPHTRTRVAISLETGLQVYWYDTPGSVEPIACDLREPLTCFTRGGHLIAASDGECQVYHTKNGRTKFVTSMPLESRPVAVVPAAIADQFALCTSAGEIRVYRIPKTTSD